MKKLKYKKYYQYIFKDEYGDLDINLNTIFWNFLEYPCERRGPYGLKSCHMMCLPPDNCELYKIGEAILKEFKEQCFTWKDLVEVRGEIHEEEFKISGLNSYYEDYWVDEFIDAVARKYNAYPGFIKTETRDGLDRIDAEAFELGCFINGIPEGEYD